MKSMQDWFDAYGESHQNPTNKLVHWICVPTIFFTIIGLLSRVPLWGDPIFPSGWIPYLHLGTILLLFGLVFYFRKSLVMGIGMLIVSAVILYGVKLVNLTYPEQALWVYLVLFIMAWVGQFIGHKIEGAKPSFFDDLKFLLIGPGWLLSFIFQKVGIKY